MTLNVLIPKRSWRRVRLVLQYLSCADIILFTVNMETSKIFRREEGAFLVRLLNFIYSRHEILQDVVFPCMDYAIPTWHK